MIKVTVHSNDLQKENVYFCEGTTDDFGKTINANGVFFKTEDGSILSVPLTQHVVKIEDIDE